MTDAVELPLDSRRGRLASRARDIAAVLPAIGLVVVLAVDALLAVNAIRVIRSGLAAVAYPFELDFAEGLVLTGTHALATGQPLYPPADALPPTISNYGPIYYAVVRRPRRHGGAPSSRRARRVAGERAARR